ncbi:MAG: alkaline phosphatase [Alphaproteobacteria bacterium PA1]|nr:MAG: alkaline phosphatase [Alphaproteobacteria bacterium PA1]
MKLSQLYASAEPMLHRRAFLASAATTALAIAPIAGCASAPTTIPALPAFPRAPKSPRLRNKGVTRVALTSCSDPTMDLSLFGDVEAAKPDLVVMMGDNVYGSASPTDPELPSLKEAYGKLADSAPFRSLVASTPTEAVWDDHDYGINDGGGDFAYKKRAQAMFSTFWNVPASSPIRHRPGIYRAFRTGQAGQVLQVILLDTRYFRDPLVPTDQRNAPGKERYIPYPSTSEADILGPDQWAFLADELNKPADVRLIISSIQVIADGHGYERWGNFPRAQQRLYDLIAETKAQGVVFASGDRHYGSINHIQTGVAYPLTDLTASGINKAFRTEPGTTAVREPATTRLGDGYGPVNFGLIDLDWAGWSLSLKLAGRGGEIVASTRLSLEDLKA